MRFLYTFTMLALASTLALGQGPRGANGGRMAAASTLNLAKVQTVSGTVTAVNIGYGMEYPSITVNKLQIKVAPAWYLLEKGFEVKTGNSVSVTAAPSTSGSDPYLYAIEISNTTSSLRLAVRDSATGVPLWSGGNRAVHGNGAGTGPAAVGGCIDPASTKTVTGTIEKISMGAGIQMPVLTLKTDGKLIELKLGPERILLASGVELKPGDAIQVTYAEETCTDELVALSITTASGATITLRDADCRPAW